MKKLSLLLAGVLCLLAMACAGEANIESTREDTWFGSNRLGQLASLAGDVHSFADATALVNQHIELGLAWYRIALDWLDWSEVVASPRFSNETVAPNDDAAITMLHDNNVEVMLDLVYWTEQTSIANPPERLYTMAGEIDSYVHYARVIAQHFRGRVSAYALLNEPNVPDPGQFVAASDYVEVVRRVAPAIRETDPGAKIVIGEITPLWDCDGLDYLRELLDSDVLPMVDGIAWHWGGASPEFQTDFYYQYPELVREIREIAQAGGFEGELLAEEVMLRTAETPHASEYMGYEVIPALKYTLRIALMNLGLDLAVGLSFENLERDSIHERMTQNLCDIMSGHEAVAIPVDIDIETDDPVAYCAFRYPNGDRIVAVWIDGIAQREDPAVPAMITFPGLVSGRVTGIDVLRGGEQELALDTDSGSSVIRDVLVTDYPILIRLSEMTTSPDYAEEPGEGFHRIGDLAITPPADETALRVVTSVADSGPGTLRSALQTARAGAVIRFDPAVFPPDAPATIRLTHVLPSLTQGDLTIDASDAGVILDGEQISGQEAWGLEIISDGNTVQGLQIVNFGGIGIAIVGRAQYNMIGGDRATGFGPLGQGNLCSGNNGGICLWDEGTSYNTITGNLIGTDVTGTEPFGNIDGMFLSGGACHNTIGPGNVIAFNQEHAIVVQGSSSLGNTITQNSIHSNAWGGIHLLEGGNDELSSPVIASFDRSTSVISGTACPACTVEIFSGFGDQGEYFEGHTQADETGAFRLAMETAPSGQFLTAAATSSSGDTSTFSGMLSCAARTVPAEREYVVTSTNDSGDGTLRWALGMAQSGDGITFDPTIFPVDEPAVILLQSGLPPIDQGGITMDASDAGVVLDGSSLDFEEAGILLTSSDNVLQGLKFVSFPGIAIRVNGVSNVIGGDPAIGAGPSGQGNVIQSCGTGILIDGEHAGYNAILGNCIGTASTGRGNFGNEYGVRILGGQGHNHIGPGNVLAYSGNVDIEIGDSSFNVIGPDNTIIQNFLPAIRIAGEASIGNVITQNTLRTTGIVRGYDPIPQGTQCIRRDCVRYAGAFDIEEPCQGGIQRPRISALNAFDGTISGTTCPSCTVEVFSGSQMSPFVYEGDTTADENGSFDFAKGSSLLGREVMLTATDPGRGTSPVGAPLCRTYAFPDTPNDGEVRIMTYNIQAMPEGYFDWRTLPTDEWELRVPQWSDFIELIEYASPDILAMQDAYAWSDPEGRILEGVAERLGYLFYAIEGELAVFSRYEIISWTPNGSAEIRLPNGRILRIVNVHIHVESHAEEPEGFQSLLRQIATYIDDPAVVLGDFNCNLVRPANHPIWFDALPRQGWQLVSDNWSVDFPYDSIWVSPTIAPFARESRIAIACSLNTLYRISDHHPVMMILEIPWSE